jgi:hypothetical protein
MPAATKYADHVCTSCGITYTPNSGRQQRCDPCRTLAKATKDTKRGIAVSDYQEQVAAFVDREGLAKLQAVQESGRVAHEAMLAKNADKAANAVADKKTPDGGDDESLGTHMESLQAKYALDAAKRDKFLARAAAENPFFEGDVDMAAEFASTRRAALGQGIRRCFENAIGYDITERIWYDLVTAMGVVIPRDSHLYAESLLK